MDYLAIQGSSVSCERLFSGAGLIDTKRRNRLAPITFSALETVKTHCKAVRKDKTGVYWNADDEDDFSMPEIPTDSGSQGNSRRAPMEIE